MKTKLLVIALLLFAAVATQSQTILSLKENRDLKLGENQIKIETPNEKKKHKESIVNSYNSSLQSIYLKLDRFENNDSLKTIVNKYYSKDPNYINKKIEKYDKKDTTKLSFNDIIQLKDFDSINPTFFNLHRLNRRDVNKAIRTTNREIRKATKDKDLGELITLDSRLKAKKALIFKYDVLFDQMRDTLAKNTNSPNNFTSFFPSSNRNKKYIFFNNLYSKEASKDLYVGNSAAVQVSKESAAAQTELLASYFGPFRATFGTMLTNNAPEETTSATSREATTTATDTPEESAFQRLLANGGNVYINVDYPVYSTQTKYTTAYGNLYAKGGMVFSNVSNDVDSSSGNGSIGANGYCSVASDDRAFILFINCNFGAFFGSPEYYQKLKISREKPFAFGQLTFGANISKALRISYTPLTFGSDESLRTGKAIFGVQILSEIFNVSKK